LAGLASLIAVLGPTTSATAASHTAKVKTQSVSHVSTHALTPAPACPAEDTCESIAGDSNVSSGTVEVGPTQNLGVNQWVYINLYGFTPNSSVHINYCTNVASFPTQPLCLTSGTALISNADYVVHTLNDGSQALSYQVLEVDTTDQALIGQEPGNGNVSGSFFCDASTPCSIDITNTGVQGLATTTMTQQNTAVVPVTFQAPSSGCGANVNPASVPTESEFGIEFVLPIAANASCSQANPSDAFNTAADGEAAMSAVGAGAAQVAFTDDPEAADQQNIITSGNYKLIPVALTANVVAFKAVSFQDQNLFPLNTMDLTPTMAAGLLTGVYDTNADADAVACNKVGCPNPPCTPSRPLSKQTCSLLGLVNFQSGFNFPGAYEAFVRSDDAGSTGLLFNWLCNAPSVPVTVNVPTSSGTFSHTFSEVTAASVLNAGFGALFKPLTQCVSTSDQYPPAPLGDPTGIKYSGFNGPDQQSIKMYAYVNPTCNSCSNPQAAFSTMNWAEARYYGEQIASLENGAGSFVAPTETSLDAAVADATTNADGSLTPSYASKDAAAYPMTSVIYAAVCADPTTNDQAGALSDMLSQLLDVTGPNSTSTLPDGFVPLPASLYKQAQSDISTDVIGGAAAVPGSCATAAGSSSSSGGSSSSGSSTTSTGSVPPIHPTPAPASLTNGHTGAVPLQTTAAGKAAGQVGFSGLGAKTSTPSGSGHPNPSGVHLVMLKLAASSSRILLPLALLLGLLALIVGGMAVASRNLREQLLGMAHTARGGLTKLRGRSGKLRGWVAGGSYESKRKW
jgi:hypothetical protein